MLNKIRNNQYRISVSGILIILYAVLSVYPFIFNVIVSFTNYDLVSKFKFMGFRNYLILFQNNYFHAALRNNSIYFLATLGIGIPLALIVGYMIYNSGKTASRIYMPLYFLPNITSLIALSLVWQLLYLPQYGLFARIFGFLGFGPQAFLSDSRYALGSIIFFIVWRSLGFDVLIIIAGINEIPKTIFDSSLIDGVTPFSRLFKIIIPLLRPQLLFLIAIKSIGALLVFEPMFMLSGAYINGPNNSLTTFMTILYESAFKQLKFGFAGAIAVIITMLLVGLVVVQLNVSKTEYTY